MVETHSTMELPLGSEAPSFRLPDASGRQWSIEDFKSDKGLVVAFICNHCPFVKHIRKELTALSSEYLDKGIDFVGINSNDFEHYEDDRPEKMRDQGYPFPYLVDESQAVAKAYRAACTPDFYVFDAHRKLVYRGQMDGSRPKNDVPVTGEDLRRVFDALLSGSSVPSEQRPSIGCNIKWKKGNEPDYFNA
jgi:thiol-disulfide isomerase/thioredoxin